MDGWVEEGRGGEEREGREGKGREGKGREGKERKACGWSVAQLDHDGEVGPIHRMYGTMEAKCAEEWLGRPRRTWTTKASLMGFGMVQQQKNADLWILICEEIHRFVRKDLH